MRKTLFTLAAIMFVAGGAFMTGCEVHHEESDHPNLLGGHTEHEKTTVTTPDGSVHAESHTTHTD
ncbi:MAG TPA: hypothetical protein VHS31_18960 [Tepidisphaeraceae bacterium]|nr:hypothetical protein [Tepidisphaeraceae bacterium]